MNVGDVVEMESQCHLILIVNDEVETSEVETGEVDKGEVNLILKFTSSSCSPHSQSDGQGENHGEVRTMEDVSTTGKVSTTSFVDSILGNPSLMN